MITVYHSACGNEKRIESLRYLYKGLHTCRGFKHVTLELDIFVSGLCAEASALGVQGLITRQKRRKNGGCYIQVINHVET